MAISVWRGQSGAVLATRIAKNIERLRLGKKWSRPQLGARLTPPTSGQQIEKLEKGDRRLTVDWLERVAKALGVDPADLIAGKGEQFTLTEPVADEVSAVLARIVLQGGEPDPATLQVLSLLLQELSATFAKYPGARLDPEVARPILGLLSRQFVQR